MFSINILCFISNFSFKGDTLYWLIPSGGIDLFIPPDSLMGETISRDTGTYFLSTGTYLLQKSTDYRYYYYCDLSSNSPCTAMHMMQVWEILIIKLWQAPRFS